MNFDTLNAYITLDMDSRPIFSKCVNAYSKRQWQLHTALNASYRQLTIQEFIDETKYELSDAMSLNNVLCYKFELPMVLTKKTIMLFGYSGDAREQKRALIRAADSYGIPYRSMNCAQYKQFREDFLGVDTEQKSLDIATTDNVVSYSMADIKNYLETLSMDVGAVYPQLVKPRKDITIILIEPEDLVKLMMAVNTSGGRQMRDVCFKSLRLLELYHEYCDMFKERALAIKDVSIETLTDEVRNVRATLDNQTAVISNQTAVISNQTAVIEDLQDDLKDNTEMLDEVQSTLNRVVDDRVVPTEQVAMHHRFVIVQLNNDDCMWEYKAIRAQRAAVQKAIEKIQVDHPRCEVVLNIEYQPNAMMFFNLMKEELRKRRRVIRVSGTYISLANMYTHDEFITDVKALHAARRARR
jgi:hypothetical protein